MTVARLLILALVLLVPISAPASGAQRTVRVQMLALLDPQRVTITPSEPMTLPSGGSVGAGESVTVTREPAGGVSATAGGWRWRGNSFDVDSRGARTRILVQGRDTRARVTTGRIEITNEEDVIQIVVEMPLEQLVASAVAAELADSDDPAALEAAAIALRSYIVTRRAHAGDGFDVCDSTHCAHSQGAPDPANPHDRAAIEACRRTEGLVLSNGGEIVPGYCTASCGGQTVTPRDVWGSNVPGFASVRCVWCRTSRYYRWTRSIRVSDVQATAKAVIGDRSPATVDVFVALARRGVAADVAVRSAEREVEVTGDAFRLAVGRRLGWDTIPSNKFRIERRRDRYIVTGAGYGHCVGLCLEGAVTLARARVDAKAILARYFPGDRIEPLPVSAN